jgi:hypothetical protein
MKTFASLPVDGRDGGRNGRRKGQALVEFTLVAPLFFLLIIGVVEVGRFVFFLETLNNATREGARYAIVHGANSRCPSGPWPADLVDPQPSTSICEGFASPVPYDEDGVHVIQRIEDSAAGLLGMGDLVVAAPVWMDVDDVLPPGRDALEDGGTGDNGRGSYVTVFADYTYDTIIGMILGTDLLPRIEINTEATLVINN